VGRELLPQIEYLAAKNYILRSKLPSRLRLFSSERIMLAEVGRRLGRQALRDIACVAKPETILACYRRLIAQKLDEAKHRQSPGRRAVAKQLEDLAVRMARENPGWGYNRAAEALVNQKKLLRFQEVPAKSIYVMPRHTASIDSEGFSSVMNLSLDILTLRAKAA
jgi:hypothetical protein